MLQSVQCVKVLEVLVLRVKVTLQHSTTQSVLSVWVLRVSRVLILKIFNCVEGVTVYICLMFYNKLKPFQVVSPTAERDTTVYAQYKECSSFDWGLNILTLYNSVLLVVFGEALLLLRRNIMYCFVCVKVRRYIVCAHGTIAYDWCIAGFSLASASLTNKLSQWSLQIFMGQERLAESRNIASQEMCWPIDIIIVFSGRTICMYTNLWRVRVISSYGGHTILRPSRPWILWGWRSHTRPQNRNLFWGLGWGLHGTHGRKIVWPPYGAR